MIVPCVLGSANERQSGHLVVSHLHSPSGVCMNARVLCLPLFLNVQLLECKFLHLCNVRLLFLGLCGDVVGDESDVECNLTGGK